MRPLLSCLFAVVALLPTSAFASACASVRPGWTPGTPATAFSEMLALFGTPPSLILLLATALVLRFRHKWGGLVVVVLWSTWLSLVAVIGRGNALQQQAALEGCIGTPTLFIAAVAAICILIVLYTSPRNTRL